MDKVIASIKFPFGQDCYITATLKEDANQIQTVEIISKFTKEQKLEISKLTLFNIVHMLRQIE